MSTGASCRARWLPYTSTFTATRMVSVAARLRLASEAAFAANDIEAIFSLELLLCCLQVLCAGWSWDGLLDLLLLPLLVLLVLLLLLVLLGRGCWLTYVHKRFSMILSHPGCHVHL